MTKQKHILIKIETPENVYEFVYYSTLPITTIFT